MGMETGLVFLGLDLFDVFFFNADGLLVFFDLI